MPSKHPGAGVLALTRGNMHAQQEAARKKLEQYRASALTGDDAYFDSERGLFYFHGKHSALVNVDAVIAVDLPSLLMAMSVVLQNTVVPILTGQLAVKAPAAPNGEQSS